MSCWTPQEITQLSEGFFNGISMKELSKRLNRTPTALNKALTRFGIRPMKKKLTPEQMVGQKILSSGIKKAANRRKIKYMKKDPLNALKKEKVLDQVFKEFHDFQRQYSQLVTQQRAKWTSVEEIVKILRSHGHIIFLVQKNKNPLLSEYYLDNKTVKIFDLLKQANEYRNQAGQGVLFVDGVTEL